MLILCTLNIWIIIIIIKWKPDMSMCMHAHYYIFLHSVASEERIMSSHDMIKLGTSI